MVRFHDNRIYLFLEVLPDSSEDEAVAPEEPGEPVLPDVPEGPLADELPLEAPDREPLVGEPPR